MGRIGVLAWPAVFSKVSEAFASHRHQQDVHHHHGVGNGMCCGMGAAAKGMHSAVTRGRGTQCMVDGQ